MSTAVVTGASRGIGQAVAKQLLMDGWWVFGLSRTRPPIQHERFIWWEHDLSRGRLVVTPGKIDALVHCAAIRGPFGPLLETSPRAWERTIRTNLLGTHAIVRACLPLLQASDDGRILLFSGGGAFSPEPNYSAYAATKGATVALMETWAAELAGDVTVNCVAPGFVATHIHDGTPHAERAAAPDAMAQVVGCIRHLLSPQTRGLTGRTVAAQYDAWEQLGLWTIPRLGEMGTRWRRPIAELERLLIHGRKAV